MNMNKYRLLAYKKTRNIGDAIQTVAISQYFPKSTAVYRNKMSFIKNKIPFIINGWIGNSYFPCELPNNKSVYFCGIHSPKNQKHFDNYDYKKIIGVRDEFTLNKLTNLNFNCELVRCPTLFFENYKGKREGVYSVDFEGPGKHITHWINSEMSWPDQWNLAIHFLNIYKKAKEVHTTRLHVVLPCLAFGTTVFFYKKQNDSRFSVLEEIDKCKSGERIIVNRNQIDNFENQFIKFLEKTLQIQIKKDSPKFPKVINSCI